MPGGWKAILALLRIAPRTAADLKDVSNIVEALEAEGLIRRDGEWWVATDQGEKDARRANRQTTPTSWAGSTRMTPEARAYRGKGWA
jgi:hypothetical protein